MSRGLAVSHFHSTCARGATNFGPGGEWTHRRGRCERSWPITNHELSYLAVVRRAQRARAESLRARADAQRARAESLRARADAQRARAESTTGNLNELLTAKLTHLARLSAGISIWLLVLFHIALLFRV
jgi:hypothetical protein